MHHINVGVWGKTYPNFNERVKIWGNKSVLNYQKNALGEMILISGGEYDAILYSILL